MRFVQLFGVYGGVILKKNGKDINHETSSSSGVTRLGSTLRHANLDTILGLNHFFWGGGVSFGGPFNVSSFIFGTFLEDPFTCATKEKALARVDGDHDYRRGVGVACFVFNGRGWRGLIYPNNRGNNMK